MCFVCVCVCFTSLLEYNCFTLVCQFLLYNKVNQLYIYINPHISSLLRLPPTLPIPHLQVDTKHRADLPVLCGCFPLAIYFTFGSIYMSMPLSQQCVFMQNCRSLNTTYPSFLIQTGKKAQISGNCPIGRWAESSGQGVICSQGPHISAGSGMVTHDIQRNLLYMLGNQCHSFFFLLSFLTEIQYMHTVLCIFTK